MTETCSIYNKDEESKEFQNKAIQECILQNDLWLYIE